MINILFYSYYIYATLLISKVIYYEYNLKIPIPKEIELTTYKS